MRGGRSIRAVRFNVLPRLRISLSLAGCSRARKRTLVQGQLCRRARAKFGMLAGGVGPEVWTCNQVPFLSCGPSLYPSYLLLLLFSPSYFLFLVEPGNFPWFGLTTL
jgi:hypothetical protein